MSHKIYILEQKSDWSGGFQKIVEETYYGPFDKSEEDVRVNDAYAEYLEASGSEIFSTLMSDEEAKKHFINTADFWRSQLDTLEFVERTNRGASEDDREKFHEYGRCEVCGSVCTKNGCEYTYAHPLAMSLG